MENFRNGEKWQQFRTLTNPIMMQPKVVTQYINIIDSIANDFMEMIQEYVDKNPQMPDNFLELYNKWALESIAAIGLDTRLGKIINNFHLFLLKRYLQVVWKKI